MQSTLLWPRYADASTAGNEAFRQREAVLRDVTGARVPDPILVLVLDAMLDGLPHRPKPKRLADDEAVQGQRIDERLALGLLQQFLELVDDHLSELAAGVVAMRLRAGIVQFHRIRHRKQRSRARLHPYRLIIERPIEQMRIARLFQEVGRDVGFERPRSHPTGGPHAHVFFDDFGALLDGARLVVLPHRPQQLGVGAAVAEHVVAAGFDLFDDLRVVIADAAVQKNRGGQFELVQDFEQAPIADTVAVVAPGEIARGLLAAANRIHPQPGAEGEMLDVERDVEGEPLASRPAVVFALDDRRIAVSGVAGKFQHWGSSLFGRSLSDFLFDAPSSTRTTSRSE